MPSYSVSVRLAQALNTRFSLLLPIMVCLLLSTAASAQVTYGGSGAVNFGSQAIGKPSANKTLTFSVASGITIGGIQVVTQGATGLDFTDAGTGSCTAGTSYSAGATCTVDVTFKPKLPGTRYGAAELLDSSGTELATAYLQGTGVGPMANFLPGIQSTIIDGLNGPTGIAVDASGNFFITAGNQVLKETLSGGSYTQSTIFNGGSSLFGVAVDGGGSLYFGDNGGFKVYKATPSAGGYTITEIGSWTPGAADPVAVAVSGDGTVYIAAWSGGSEVLKETPLATGGYAESVVYSDQCVEEIDIAVDGQNNLYISGFTLCSAMYRWGESFVVKETPSGGSYTDGGNYTRSPIASFPGVVDGLGLEVDGSGNVYIVRNGGVAKFTPISNNYIQSALAITTSASAVAADGSGNVYAFNGGSLSKLELAEPPSLAFATTTAAQTSTDSPQTVTLENAGNTGLILTGLSYPVDFPPASLSSCAKDTSLAAGQWCSLAIDFTPLSVGSLSEVVTLTDNTLNVYGSQQEIAVSGTGAGVAGEATHFVVTTTGSVGAGSPFSLTVTGIDYLGNTATLYSGSVALTSSDPLFVTPGTVALSGGVGQMTVTLKTSGAQTITATDTTNSALKGTGSFTVASAATATLVVMVPVAAKIDRAYPVTVTAEDVYGNQAIGYTGTVSFSSTDPSATLPGPSSLNAGARTFQAILRTQGQQTVTVTDSANHLSSTSAAIVVSQNAPNGWTWMGGNSTIGSNCTPNQVGLNCGRPGVYGTLGEPARGNAPGARSGAQSWTDARGNLWLFGGTGYDGNGTYGGLNDLWELNPFTDYWTWMGGSRTVPGESGNWPGVYGNLGTAAAENMPGSRSGASTWTDASGNLWLFGGSGSDAVGAGGYLNDLWEFKPGSNQWVWMGGSSTIGSGHPGVYGTMGTPAAENMPGSRSGASSWTDSTGHLWLFGGASFSNGFYYFTWYLNDLWEYFPDRNEWAWMGGSSFNNPAGVFPSESFDPNNFSSGWTGEYGSLGMPATGNNPGSRSGASNWTDGTGRLWLFGGYGFDSVGSSSRPLNDLWEFDPATREWTWESGNNANPYTFGGLPGTYGTLGSPSTANAPGSRIGASSWTDRNGQLWLFGGVGYDADFSPGELNDLWVFDPATDEWAWMSGSSTVACLPQNNGNCGQPGVYGVLGTPAAGNVPGGRSGASSWIDNRGNLWLFGGDGFDANDVTNNLNDLWEYELSVTIAVTPTVTVTPSSSSITATQSLSVTVTVSGGAGKPTPTGTVTLASGGYTSGATDLSSGSATINIPAGNLATGADVLTATYTPDSSGSLIYNSATGTSPTVTVTQAKMTATVTVSPSATSITTAQALTVALTVSGPAGNPTPTGAVTLTSDAYTSSATTLNAGGATISIPAGALSTGNDTLTVVYLGDNNYGTATGTASINVNPSPSFTLSASPANVSIVQGGSGTSTITVTAIGGFSGDVTLSASGLPDGVTSSFAAGSAAETQVFTLAASTSAAVTSTPVTVTITGTSGTLSTNTSLTVTIAAQSSFMAGNGGTTSITVARGATTGNTGTISVVGTNGFIGTVNLTCKTTTLMTNVNDMPTCSLSPLSVNIQGAIAQTSTLTINTTAATSANNQLEKLIWPSAGGATLALLLFFTLPKRRNWLAMLGVLVLFVSVGTLGCGGGGSSQGSGGGGNSGTTVGSYTITVTGTSGALSVTVGTVTLTVQ